MQNSSMTATVNPRIKVQNLIQARLIKSIERKTCLVNIVKLLNFFSDTGRFQGLVYCLLQHQSVFLLK